MKARLTELGCDSADYLAGIWRESLPEALTWSTQAESSRPKTYRAPSWSWASVDGRVYVPSPWEEPQKKIIYASTLSATTAYRGTEDTGHVTTGSITISGPLGMAKILSATEPRRMGSFGAFERRRRQVKSIGGLSGQGAILDAPTYRGRCLWSVSFDTEDDICDQAICLPIVSAVFKTRWTTSSLVLTPIDGNKYRRVGVLIWQMFDKPVNLEGLFDGLTPKTIEIL
jgi:hypothetical protein